MIYVPRKQFLPFHYRENRWAALVCHRRAGKTVACVNELLTRALATSKDRAVYAYVAPFRYQAKQIAWEYLKEYGRQVIRSVNESELMVELFTGSKIRLYGADNPDALRGIYLDGVVLDEYADMRPSVWGTIIRPMLADRRGWGVFIGTPKGHNAFYDIWQAAAGSDEWFRLMLKASQSGILDGDELRAAQKTMSEDQYQQEFECSFEAAITGAVYGRWMREAEEAGRVTPKVAYDPSYPVYTAWDLGYDDATAIWFFQVGMGEIFMIDYYESSGEAVGHYCDVVKGKPYQYHAHYVPHDALNEVMAAGGRSIVQQARALGVRMVAIPATSQQNGIEALRLTLPRCWFKSDACRDGIEALKNYCFEYDEEKKAFKPKPRHDWSSHAADAAEIVARVWRSRPVTQDELKRKALEENFHRLRREHLLDNVDPYRVKPERGKR